MSSSLDQPIWRVIDHTAYHHLYDALDSFAIDDALCSFVGNRQSPPVMRFWIHQPTVVLGIQDSRLPRVVQAAEYLRESGFDVIVRNSGGLAVVLDETVLNLSLILPTDDVFANIDYGYETMWELVKQMLSPFQHEVEAREIVGSYCPGRYDLSINGRKFSGISQRRTRGGVAVQSFLLTSGSGKERGELIRRFYQIAAPDDIGKKDNVLDIRPETLASLSELLSADVTVDELKKRAIQVLEERGCSITMSELSADEEAKRNDSRERMIARNERFR